MHVHLIEPLATGHRLQFVRRLVETDLPGLTWSLSTFPSTRAHPAFAPLAPRFTAIHDITDEAGHQELSAGTRGLSASRLWWRLLHRHWQGLPAGARAAPQLVPYLDYFLYAAGLHGSPFGAAPLAGISMRPSFHYRAMGVRAPRTLAAPLQRWLLGRLLARPELVRFYTLDEPLADWLRARRPQTVGKVTYVQDPADLAGSGGPAEGRARYGVRPGQRVVLTFGSISALKGVDALLAALAAPSCPTDLAALVVGLWQPSLRPLLDSSAARTLRQAGRLHLHDAYVDAQDEHLAFAAADAVWIGYRKFYGSSGVLMQAAKTGVPVIGSRDGLVGWSIARHHLGESVDIDDAAAVAAALVRVLATPREAWRAPQHLREPPEMGRAVLEPLLRDLAARGAGGSGTA